MEELLQQVGLNELQARAYLYLLKYGESSPPQIAKDLDITRSNSYKILDKLVALGLLSQSEIHNKFFYKAEDPVVLLALVASERNRLIKLEKDLKGTVSELRKSYDKQLHNQNVAVTHSGKDTVSNLYASLIKAPHKIHKSHGAHSNVSASETTPVEWIVSKNTLTIFSFGDKPLALQISNRLISKAFLRLIDKAA